MPLPMFPEIEKKKRAKLRSFPHIRIKRKKRKEMRDIVISPPSIPSFVREAESERGTKREKKESRKKSGKARLRKKFEIRDPLLSCRGKRHGNTKVSLPFLFSMLKFALSLQAEEGRYGIRTPPQRKRRRRRKEAAIYHPGRREKSQNQ